MRPTADLNHADETFWVFKANVRV